MPTRPPNIRDITDIVPACPKCGGSNYVSAPVKMGRPADPATLTCAACGEDILAEFHRRLRERR